MTELNFKVRKLHMAKHLLIQEKRLHVSKQRNTPILSKVGHLPLLLLLKTKFILRSLHKLLANIL